MEIFLKIVFILTATAVELSINNPTNETEWNQIKLSLTKGDSNSLNETDLKVANETGFESLDGLQREEYNFVSLNMIRID